MIIKQSVFVSKLIKEKMNFTYGKENVAGDEIIPNKFIYHVSNPIYRKEILKNGLQPKVGDSYSMHVGDKHTIVPAIFATNSENKKYWFDSTYDDDIWEIDTSEMNNKWFIDKHYGNTNDHYYILTFEQIPRKYIKLIYKGTGDSQ